MRARAARSRPSAAHRGRRLRPESCARGVRGRGRRRSTSSSAARAMSRSGSCCARSRPAAPLGGIAGLSWRAGRSVRAELRRGPSATSAMTSDRPIAAARVLGGYTLLGRQIDVVETSRGCTFDCSFCSIIEMRGRNFHTWPDRARRRRHRATPGHAARAPSSWSTTTSRSTSRASRRCATRSSTPGLHDIDYRRAGHDVAPIAAGGDALGPAMRRAGFRYVFLGIENVAGRGPGVSAARGRRTRDASGGRAAGNATVEAVEHAPPPRHAGRRRPHRRQSERFARVDRSEPGLRAPVRRLALHPASDALPGHADDARTFARKASS